MTLRVTETRSKTADPTNKVNPSEKLDGNKPQPINQFRLTNKAAGEKTKKIKEDWHDSITMAHTMLVNVNTELDSILAELDDISDALKKLGKGTGLDGVVKKFNDVQTEIKIASDTAKGFVDSFYKDLPPRLVKAGSAIEKFTKKDFENLEEQIGKEKVGKTKTTFAKIRAFEQNVKNNFQDADQPADLSGKKKSQKARHGQDVLRESSDNSSSEVSTASEGSSSDDSDFSKSHVKTKKKSNSASSDENSSLVETTTAYSDEERTKANSSSESSPVDDED